jgi:hypothetical protein
LGDIEIGVSVLLEQRDREREAEIFVLVKSTPVHTIEAGKVAVITGLGADLTVLATGLVMLVKTFIAVVNTLDLVLVAFSVILKTVLTFVAISLARIWAWSIGWS